MIIKLGRLLDLEVDQGEVHFGAKGPKVVDGLDGVHEGEEKVDDPLVRVGVASLREVLLVNAVSCTVHEESSLHVLVTSRPLDDVRLLFGLDLFSGEVLVVVQVLYTHTLQLAL